ncbi:MAG: 2-hydroxycarboxylate transporter family protein, partial [Cetobacterium somerae]|uniref:2-hydroxycarboxylate transporter family protein n=1 Tax=Cetobacterium somerae TaxID=188913 RepID=UPI003F329F6E
MNNQEAVLLRDMDNVKKVTFLELDLKYFIPIFIIILVAAYTNSLPKGMIGAFAFMMTFGAILDYVGNKMP